MEEEKIIGQKYGQLKVIKILPPIKYSFKSGKKDSKKMVLCLCDCGKLTEVRFTFIKNGVTKTCNCSFEPHEAKHKNEYKTYHGCKYRCANTSNKNYAGRGITFKYTSFKEFLKDLGEKPSSKHSVDRINNDGNYEVGNCRWSTAKVQANNRRKPTYKKIYNNLTYAEASILLGGSRNLISERVKKGWSKEKAFNTPLR